MGRQETNHQFGVTEAPLVAVCMATFNPDLRLFEQQVTSIREQTYERILCFVRDDGSERGSARGDRADLCARTAAFPSRAEGFVSASTAISNGRSRSFPQKVDFRGLLRPGRCLASGQARRPDRRRLSGAGANLTYADMNIVSRGRASCSSSRTGPIGVTTGPTSGSLLLINTVTGAASLFRRELLNDALPFPRATGEAVTTTTGSPAWRWPSGTIAFVNPASTRLRPARSQRRRPPRAAPWTSSRAGSSTPSRRFVRHPRRRWRNTIAHASKYYEDDVVPRELFARTLEQRLGYRLSPPRAREVRRVARLSSSLESLGWLVARSAQDVRGRSETLGLENQLIKGIVWHRMRAARARVRRARARFL